jgi:hypothetical protein
MGCGRREYTAQDRAKDLTSPRGRSTLSRCDCSTSAEPAMMAPPPGEERCMTRTELVDHVAAAIQLPKVHTDAVLAQCLQPMMDTLQAGSETHPSHAYSHGPSCSCPSPIAYGERLQTLCGSSGPRTWRPPRRRLGLSPWGETWSVPAAPCARGRWGTVCAFSSRIPAHGSGAHPSSARVDHPQRQRGRARRRDTHQPWRHACIRREGEQCRGVRLVREAPFVPMAQLPAERWQTAAASL